MDTFLTISMVCWVLSILSSKFLFHFFLGRNNLSANPLNKKTWVTAIEVTDYYLDDPKINKKMRNALMRYRIWEIANIFGIPGSIILTVVVFVILHLS